MKHQSVADLRKALANAIDAAGPDLFVSAYPSCGYNHRDRGDNVSTVPVVLSRVPHLAGKDEYWCVDLVNDTSRYAFWRAYGRGTGGVVVRYGKIGTDGRSTSCSYGEAIKRIGDKLSKDYSYSHLTNSAVPAAAQPPKQRAKTLREMMGGTTMRPTTSMQLLEAASTHGFSKISTEGEDYTDVYQGADAISVLQAKNGRLWVLVRYDKDLLIGKLKDR